MLYLPAGYFTLLINTSTMLIKELLCELNTKQELNVGDRVRHPKLMNPILNPKGFGEIKFKNGPKVYVLPDGQSTKYLPGGRLDINKLQHFDQGQLTSLQGNQNPITRKMLRSLSKTI
jgi:hypothetical protein